MLLQLFLNFLSNYTVEEFHLENIIVKP